MAVASLSTFEISAYTAAWAFSVCYAIYNVFLASRTHFYSLYAEDLEVGWFGQSGWLKDVSDNEWNTFSEVILTSLPWLAIHFVGAQYFKKSESKLLPCFYSLLGAIFVAKLIGVNGLLFLSVQPLAMFLLHLLNSPPLLYFAAVSYVGFQDSGPLAFFERVLLGDGGYSREKYIASVTNSWINARCLSFCLDRLWREVPSAGSLGKDLLNMFAYCFYLPTVFSGPLINYKEFHAGLVSPYIPWTVRRWTEFFSTLLRYSFWFLFNNLVLHFLHFNALQFNLGIMRDRVDLWTLCGVGYSMGQFFHMKYLVFYGFPVAFARSDGISPPSPPKCIGRIHLYSDMWRYFDNGLYRFIHKYFYRPVIDSLGNTLLTKLIASAVTFSFIYIWHGVQRQVLVWTVLNFVGITLEATARAMASTHSFQRLEKSALGPRGRRRLYALLGAPLFLMSILSNFYFFMGVELGNLFVQRSLLSWPIGTPLILFFMYCAAQTSYEMKNHGI